jgi:hypothetical protein
MFGGFGHFVEVLPVNVKGTCCVACLKGSTKEGTLLSSSFGIEFLWLTGGLKQCFCFLSSPAVYIWCQKCQHI